MATCEVFATKAEVAALRAEIDKLKGNQIDINSLIQKAKNAVFSDQQWILALGAIAAFRNLDLSKYLTKQDPIVNKVEQARNLAESAYKNTNNLHADLQEAKNVANAAKNQAGAASGVANAAKQATNVLATDISRLGGALGIIGGIVNSILSILSVVGGAAGLLSLFGLLYSIIPRLDAQEAYLDATAKTAADAYSLAASNQMQLRDYKAKTDKRIAQLERNVTDLTIQLRQTQDEIFRLEKELEKANANIKYLSSELTKAKAIIESLIAAIRQQQTVIESLQSQLQQLSASTDSRFKDLQAQADAIRKQAEAAIAEANRATAAANEALRRAGKADDTSRQAQQDVNSGEATKRWQPKVFEPIVTNIQTRVNQQVQPLKIEIGNFEKSRQELQANIEKQFGRLPTFEERLAKNEAEVKKQQGSLPTFNDLDSVNRSLNRNLDESYKELEKLKDQTKQIEQKQAEQTKTPTMPTWVDQRFKEIEKVNAEANKKLDDIQKNFDKLPGLIGNIFKPQLDKLPQTVVETVTPALTGNLAPALIKIAPQISDAVSQTITKEAPKIGDVLKPVLNNIPAATALLIPFALIGSAPFTQKMTDVAAAGTCKTTQPGGCSTNLINNATNNVNQNVNNTLRDLRDNLDASAGADTNLRVRNIEDKLGANEYPMLLPEYLLDDHLDTQVVIPNQARYNEWLLKQIDALVGLFPIKIERTDEDGQKQTLKFENIAEAIAELTGFLAQIAFDADTAVNVATRATGEALGAKAAALQAGSYLKAIIDHMGFQTQSMAIDVPVSVTLAATGVDGKLQESELKDFLKPSTQKVIGIKNTDPVDARLTWQRILQNTEIARAALYRPLKPNVAENTLTGDGIKAEKAEEKKRLDKAWEAFKTRIENHTTETKIDIDDRNQEEQP